MTDQPDIEAIAARAAAATPGPWVVRERLRGKGAQTFGHVIILEDRSGYPGAVLEGMRANTDADFIAHAREDIPALIERLQAVKAEAEELTDSLIAVNQQHAEAIIERDRWREDAERLAEGIAAGAKLYSSATPRQWTEAMLALAAHDAMKKEQG